jgi:hypothetical protein
MLEQNKQMATHNDGYSPKPRLRRVASIPYGVGLKWLNEEGWWFMDARQGPRRGQEAGRQAELQRIPLPAHR